jgi:phosphatidate cytidylyltransferase
VKRVLTAAVAIPLVFLVILKGGRIGFTILIGTAAVLGLLEYYNLFLPRESVTERRVGLICCLALIAAFYGEDVGARLSVLVLVFIVTAVLCLARYETGSSMVAILSRQIMGFVYIPFFLGHFILIRGWQEGISWAFFLLAVVFAGDSAAYYVGKTFGRHKLSPSISPGKTMEGAVGGLGGNLLVGILFKAFWFPELSWTSCTALVLLLGVLGQIGDLVESMLKRSVQIKDSGRFLPGHGGMLDRIDGLLFAVPVLYYFKNYLL